MCVCICGLDTQGSNQPCGHPWNLGQQRRLKDTDQSPHLSLRPQVSPPSPPHFLPTSTTPAGRPPSSHQLQPIPCSAGSCLRDPEGLAESWRSEVALHTATNGTSQKSVYQKPCGDTPTWPWDSEEKTGIPPLLFNNALFNHSHPESCLFSCDFFFFFKSGFLFLASFHIWMIKLYVLSLVAVVQALSAVVGCALMPWTKFNLWPLKAMVNGIKAFKHISYLENTGMA